MATAKKFTVATGLSGFGKQILEKLETNNGQLKY